MVKKRKATTSKFAEKRSTDITKDMVKSMSFAELKSNIRIYGKRAQSRLSSLQKSLHKLTEKGVSGMAEMLLDRYSGYNVKTKGLSVSALRAKLYRAIDILNAETSTAAGILNLEERRYETFKANHKGLKDISIDTYRQYVKVMGKVQAAHEGLKYDSDIDIYAALKTVDEGWPIDFYTQIINPESFFEDDDYWQTVNKVFGFEKL